MVILGYSCVYVFFATAMLPKGGLKNAEDE